MNLPVLKKMFTKLNTYCNSNSQSFIRHKIKMVERKRNNREVNMSLVITFHKIIKSTVTNSNILSFTTEKHNAYFTHLAPHDYNTVHPLLRFVRVAMSPLLEL